MIVGRPALEILLNGWVLIIIVVSIISIGTILDRILYFRALKLKVRELLSGVREAIKKGSLKEVHEICDKKNHPIARMVKDIVGMIGLPRKQFVDSVDRMILRERKEIEAHVPVLSVAAFIAPLLGLLGTVVGIVQAFSALARAGGGTPTEMMGGIAVALVTTACGIIVAVPAAIAFGVFGGKVDVMERQMKMVGKSIIRVLSEAKKIDTTVAEKIRKKIEAKKKFNPSEFSEALVPGINVALLCVCVYMIFIPNMYQTNFTVSTPTLKKVEEKKEEEKKKETELKVVIMIEEDGSMYINNELMPPDTGAQNALIRQLLLRSLNRLVVISGDEKLYHYQIVDVMDRAVQCGAERVCLLKRRAG